MKNINSLEELKLPHLYKGFLKHFLFNISNAKSVSRVILFGSCAREQIQDKSDIDLLVLTEKEVELDEEFYIMSDCPPLYDNEYYIPSDIIVNSIECYNKYKNTFGMIQKQVEREGVDLSGLL